MKIPFVGPSYQQDALSFDIQRSINQYPMVSEIGTSKEVSSLRGTPGLRLFLAAGGGPHRGCMTAANGRAFVVSGNQFFEITSGGAAILRGTLLSYSVRVGLAENNAGEIMIVDSAYGYIFDMPSNVFTQITDPDFPPCSTVTFQDGYFIVPKLDTQEYYISGINNGFAWAALDFGTASVSPDNLNCAISSNSNLWLLGERSIEVHQNTGAAAFPFERIPGAVIQTGCAAEFTVQKFDNTIAWLGFDDQGRGVVWKANGYNAERISTQSIERRIAEVPDFTDAYAWVYHEQGHVFYMLQIRGLDTTLCYDGSTGQWHERAYFNGQSGSYELHKGACFFFLDQRQFVCDRINGNIYEMNLFIYDDAGDPIVRERISPHLQDEKRLITHSCFELDMQVGIGLVSGQGSDPQIMMQYSDDGGRNWSAELWRSVGPLGDFSRRVAWRKLGKARDRVYRVRYSEPTQYQVNGAYLNAT